MKLLLVIDVADGVAEKYDWLSIDYDLYGTNADVSDSIKCVKCAKAKPLPEKMIPEMVMGNKFAEGCVKGWNDCIKEITE